MGLELVHTTVCLPIAEFDIWNSAFISVGRSEEFWKTRDIDLSGPIESRFFCHCAECFGFDACVSNCSKYKLELSLLASRHMNVGGLADPDW